MAETKPESALTPPDFDDALEDLERETNERAGRAPAPWKTIPFWLSALATIVAFILASGLPVTHWLVQIATPVGMVLYYLGYNVASNRLRSRSYPNQPAYRTKDYWLDVATTALGFVMGSGLAETDPVMQVGGILVALAAQIGIDVVVWVRRNRMVDPTNLDADDVGEVLGRINEGQNELPNNEETPEDEDTDGTVEESESV